MSLPKHLDDAVARLKAASLQIDEARAKPGSMDALQQWLSALTDFCRALSDIQAFSNEAIHEKLDELAGRVGLHEFPPVAPKA